MAKFTYIPRDLSWLSFNGRVLQEANDPTVPLKERIRFLGIFSNNLDEFFRVRVATLKRMTEFADKKGNIQNIDLIESPQAILDEIQRIVLRQQNEFNRIWQNLNKELKENKIVLVDDKKLNPEQKNFVKTYFDEVVRPYIIPLMIENVPELPYLRDKSLYLAIVMANKSNAYDQKFSLIEIPSKSVGRFIELPSKTGTSNIILLEDLIRYNLPIIFSHFKFNKFELHEVLFVMNQVFFKLKILNPIYVQIIERFVRLFMPKHINNQIKAQNWIILALDYCDL